MQFSRALTPDDMVPTARPSSGMSRQLPPVTPSTYSERFGVPTRLGARPASRAERKVCLRKLSLSQPLVARAPEDTTAQEWVYSKRQAKEEVGCTSRIAALEADLVSELNRIGNCDPYQRLAAHRNAFMRYVDAQDIATQFFLRRVLKEYEEATVHKFQDRYEAAVRHQDQAERGTRVLEGERRQLLHRIEGLHLQVENLERQLRSKVETLAHMSAKHNLQIPVDSASLMGIPSQAPPSRTLTDIVATQKKLEAKAAGGNWDHENLAIEEAMRKECEEAEKLLADMPRPGFALIEESPALPPPSVVPHIERLAVAPLSLLEAQRAARTQLEALGCELSPHPSLDDSPRGEYS